MTLIEPRTLKGFRDYLPEAMLPRERLIETARRVYRSYGFAPIDTPALEYEEILRGKGGEESDKQMYAFEDHGGRRVALRFDLTVPLARFVAQHQAELPLPFKRYHIAPVWRGENTQRGRYREFLQCDFDTIGTESLTADIETALVIHDLFKAIGFEKFTIRVNNRRLLTGILEEWKVNEKAVEVMRVIDQLEKIDRVAAIGKLTELGVSHAQSFVEIFAGGLTSFPNAQILEILSNQGAAKNERGQRGIAELREVLQGFESAADPARIRIDPSIARGLDYYTGTVFETRLDDLSGIGSVCSGGRYDDLASIYTKQRLPGIGASLGLDRLLAAMEELKMFEGIAAPAPVFLAFFTQSRRDDYLKLAARLRADGIGVEFFPEPKKLGQQLKFADRKGFKLAVIIGDDEWAKGEAQVKDLKSGGSKSVAIDALARELKSAIG